MVHVTLVKPNILQKLDWMNIIIQLKVWNYQNIFKTQVFTNCMHGYDCVSNANAYGITHTKKCVDSIDSLMVLMVLTKIKTTTTAFLISNTVVPTPSNHIVQHSILNLSHPYLKLQITLIDLLQSEILIFHSLQIDHGIWQYANSNWTGIFKQAHVIENVSLKILTEFCGKEKNTARRNYLRWLNTPDEWYALNRRGYKKYFIDLLFYLN